MDQYLDTACELAKVKYILRNERPAGKMLAEYKLDKRKLKGELKILHGIIERAGKKAIRKANKRSIRDRVMFISYGILVALILIACIATAFGPQIIAMIKEALPQSVLSILRKLIGG